MVKRNSMEDSQEEEGTVHLDEVLGRLGGLGRHQMATMAMLALVYATNSMYNVNYVFAVEDVGYRCVIPECESPTSPFNTSSQWRAVAAPVSQQQCYRYAPAQGCAFDNATLVECEQWVYEVPDSFVAEFGLACQNWKQAMVGTAHCFGNMLGLLVQGQISDRFGRKTAAVFAGSMGAVLGLAKSFSSSYWLYVALETLEAAIGDALSPMFMLSIEIVEKKKAVLFQMILLNFYTCGLIIMPFIAQALPYWRHFLRSIYTPTLLVLTYSLYLDESIRWLFSKGQKDKAIQLIQKIAKRNKIDLDQEILHKLEYIGDDKSSGDVISDRKLLLKTFKSKIMMRRFAVCLVWWFTITLINYGMMISSVFIDGNKYVNFALLMLMDIPSNVFYWVALSKYKRKIPLVTSFIIGGIFCVVQPFVTKEYAWLGLALLMVFESLATFSYNIVYMYTSELFPTYTRNSVHALCGAAGRLGSLIAPQAPLLISYWSGLPALLFGLTSLLSGFLALFMPETAQCELPDTVAEAERIGRRRSKPNIEVRQVEKEPEMDALLRKENGVTVPSKSEKEDDGGEQVESAQSNNRS